MYPRYSYVSLIHCLQPRRDYDSTARDFLAVARQLQSRRSLVAVVTTALGGGYNYDSTAIF